MYYYYFYWCIRDIILGVYINVCGHICVTVCMCGVRGQLCRACSLHPILHVFEELNSSYQAISAFT